MDRKEVHLNCYSSKDIFRSKDLGCWNLICFGQDPLWCISYWMPLIPKPSFFFLKYITGSQDELDLSHWCGSEYWRDAQA